MENEVQNQQPNENQKTPMTPTVALAKFKKNKKLLAAGILLLFLVLSTILFAVLYSQKVAKTPQPTTQQQPKEEAYGSVLLTPVNIIGTPGKKSTVDVVLNTGGKKITGAIIALQYNSRILENVALTPFQDKYSALGYSLKQKGQTIIDDKKGIIILTLALPNDMQDLAGTGTVAQLSFTVKSLKVAVTSTTISLTPLTGFLSSTRGEHTNLARNQLVVTLPAGIPLVSPTIIQK